MIPDFTSQEIANLKAVASVYQQGNLVTEQYVRDQITLNGASFKSSPDVQLATISSGAITIFRRAQVTHAKVATEGGATTDTLDSISTNGFTQGDILILMMAQDGMTITTSTAGNISPDIFTWSETSNILALVYDGSAFNEIGRYPKLQTQTITQQECFIQGGGVNAITIGTAWAKTRYLDLGTETLATATIQITATAGTSGNIIAVVDNNSGVNVEIGTAGYLAPDIPNNIAAKLNTAINLGTATHGYSSSVLGDTCTITAPVGSGATANTWLMGANVSGGLTAATTNFVGGVDASEAASDLDDIFGGLDNQELILTNTMSAASITLTAIGNIHSSAAGALAAGASLRLINDPEINKWRKIA